MYVDFRALTRDQAGMVNPYKEGFSPKTDKNFGTRLSRHAGFPMPAMEFFVGANAAGFERLESCQNPTEPREIGEWIERAQGNHQDH